MNRMNENHVPSPHHLRTSPEINNWNNSLEKASPRPPSKRDFGVMCGALTRNVGVGHQYPRTKSVSTLTTNGDAHNYTDKWFNEKIKFLSNRDENANGNESAFAATQKDNKKIEVTPLPKTTRETGSQTPEPKPAPKKVNRDNCSQTTEVKKQFQHVGSSAKPSTVQCGIQTSAAKANSNSVQVDIPCLKCNIAKTSIGVGPENKADSHVQPVSLANLAVPRSKSFNLDGEKLNLRLKNRTVGCQYESVTFTNAIACQTEKKVSSKSCQNEVKVSHRAVQHENTSVSKNTDTKDLSSGKQSVACEAKEIKNTAEFGCNTTAHVPEKIVCTKCSNKEKDSGLNKESVPNSPTPSRIPRPQVSPIVENRRFKRQDTYTKIPASPEKFTDFSG